MLFLSITHEEALRRSSEARASGDRETAKKYSNIARDLQRRETSGDTSIDFYDTETGRVRHSEAGSETYVSHMLGTSDRYVPISKKQVQEVRSYQREARDQPELIVPRQTVSRGGEELYTVEPGEQPRTATLTFPGEQPKWTVTYDAGYGEQTKEFASREEAEEFSSSLTSRFETKTHELRERGFTLIGDFYEYLKSIGPPLPTEEQQTRIEAGLPLQGLPGPGTTKPGSVKEVLEDFMRQTLDRTEKPFEAVTKPIRNLESVFSRISLKVLDPEIAFQPPTLLGSQTQPIYDIRDTFKVPHKPEPATGTAFYLGSVGAAVLASGFDVATFEVRPGLVAKSAGALISLGVDREVQTAFSESVKSDPFKFFATIAGSTVVGMNLREALPKTESALRKFWAKREFDRLGLDERLFTQFERELLFDFPEETVDSVTQTTIFKRSHLKVLDDVGLIEKKIPFFTKTEPQTEKILDQMASTEPDTWNPAQVTKELESYFALPFDKRSGSILVRGKAGMKPFKEATAPLPPRSEQVAVLTTKTPSMKLTPVSTFFKTTMVKEAVFHIPAVDLRATLLTTPTPLIPASFPPVSIAAILAIKPLPISDNRLDKITEELFTTPALRQFLTQTPFQVQAPRPVQTQTPVSVQTQPQLPTQTQIPIPLVTNIQSIKEIQIPKLQLIQEPVIEIVPPSIPDVRIDPPTSPPKLPIKTKKKKKKKKKRKRKVKGAYELRVDKILDDILKDVKL